MASSEFVLRPYDGVERIQEALEEWRLDVANAIVVPGGTLAMTPAEYLRADVDLLPAFPVDAGDHVDPLRAGVAELGLDLEDLELVVAVVARRLKIVELPVRGPVSVLHGMRTPIRLASAGHRPGPLTMPYSGCSIEVYVALARQLEPSATRPWRKGTWLGRIEFRLHTSAGFSGFTPIPLSDDLRRRMGLSSGTVRFVEVDDPLEPGAEGHAVRLYVDEALLDSLADSPSSPASRTVQRQLFLDAVSAVIHQSSARLNSDDSLGVDDADDTLLGALLDRFAADVDAVDRRAAREHAFRMLRSDPARCIAMSEAWIGGLGSDLVKTVGGSS